MHSSLNVAITYISAAIYHDISDLSDIAIDENNKCTHLILKWDITPTPTLSLSYCIEIKTELQVT